MEVREITTAIVQEIGKRDARIYELELRVKDLEQEVEFLTKTLDIMSAEAAEEDKS